MREQFHGSLNMELISSRPSLANPHRQNMNPDQTAKFIQHASYDAISRHDIGGQLREIGQRNVWLPGFFYESLPVLYILIGILALVSAVFNRHWSWLVPHIVLVGCFFVHLGIMVRRARLKARTKAALPGT